MLFTVVVKGKNIILLKNMGKTLSVSTKLLTHFFLLLTREVKTQSEFCNLTIQWDGVQKSMIDTQAYYRIQQTSSKKQ